MKILYCFLFLFIFSSASFAQNFKGQWKGGFLDNTSIQSSSGLGNIDYVLEIETSGKVVKGYSYTYFSEGNKQYYTICRLEGTVNKKTKELFVTEVERTKFNTPPDFRNCFQTHLLKYSKLNSDTEQLAGTWIPAPNQTGDCGKGRTILYRKIFKKATVKSAVLIKKKTNPAVHPAPKKSIPSPVPKNNLPKKQQDKLIPTETHNDSIKGKSTVHPPIARQPNENIAPDGNFQPRIKSLIKTLDIKEEKFTVDFYDNGAVDGDSITVFFNGKIVVSHLGLTEKPASFTLTIDKNLPYNELVMYAENMGTIPPNTALMVVKDGTKQYEVNITSDTERSGTIRFRYKAKE